MLIDEADISSLLLEMHLASCGLDGQHQLEMPSHIEEPKNRNSEMLCLIRIVLFSSILKYVQLHMHAQLSVYVPLVFTIVANNGNTLPPS